MTDATIVLGIESSCDETAAAVVRLSSAGCEVIANCVYTQTLEHTPYGGVVPEIAARAHVEKMDATVKAAMIEAGVSLKDLTAVASTTGPGLIGSVLVGLMTGKALAQAANIPFVPINHLEGHALSPRLTEDCPFPYLLLLVSGGHCQYISVGGLGDYNRLGSTIDDAVGEAFDKTAKILGLGFPGGPAVETCAQSGDAKAFDFPRPLLRRPGLDLSFAGLKTAVRRAAEEGELNDQRRADLCASFQMAVCDVLGEKTARALDVFEVAKGEEKRLVVAGGVASNQAIRSRLSMVASQAGAAFIAPPLKYCTDNAAMIALAGAEHVRSGRKFVEGLSVSARPRWPLDEVAAANEPVYGAGKRGAKA